MVTFTPLSPQGRVTRRPEHTFNIRQKPWIIQPFMIAPVLPGETFKNLLLQARVVSDPVKNPLIGWWIEYYFFYVKLRDLAGRQTYENMMLDGELTTSALNAPAKVATYHNDAASPDYVQQCLDTVVEWYFRAEGEGPHNLDNMPLASVNRTDWLDSVINDASFVAPIDIDVDGPDANSTIQASEVDKALNTWQLLRAQNLTDMGFEDYLATYGVKVTKEDDHQPELIRYMKQWTYPSNTVDPTTGVPSSAISWSVQERADKDRFCREPGFLFGVTIARPKIYMSNMKGAAVEMMTSAQRWLPAIMRDDPYTSLVKMAAGTGPLSANTDAYWVDLKDLFLYGDQFINFALTETNAGLVALPTAALDKRYVTEAMIDGLFVSTGADMVKQDGVVQLNILGSLKDTTPPIGRLGTR